MNRIIPFITTANDNLVNQVNIIQDAIKVAEGYTFSRLHIDWDINLVVTNRVYDIIIPEDGVGGRTYTSDFIMISIDEHKATKEAIAEMLVHELCHAARWGKNDEWASTLLDNILSEGIATSFQADFAKTRPTQQAFLSTVTSRSEAENQKVLSRLKDQLGQTRYDYPQIFFHGDENLPKWSGYSLGYYFIQKYLTITGKTIETAFTDKYAEVKSALQL